VPEKIQATRIFDFQGGYATDLAPQIRELTFLERAENVLYSVGGSTLKVGGSERVNSSAISGTPNITGMRDFWITGTGGSYTQKFVIMTSNQKIFKEDMDGTFDEITGSASITADAIPVFCQAGDLLLIFTNKNDTPLKWTGSGNVATLGGSPPAGRGAVLHLNRVWTWGANANPSRITYGAAGDPEDYTGGDTGAIDIANDDGDRITGVVSHKDRLFIFKGPNVGSIHVMSGRTTSTFVITKLVAGIALQSHNSIVEIGNDVWFMSDRGIHSLSATEKFGDFTESDLTRFLRKFFTDKIKRAALDAVWGVNYIGKSSVVWTLTDIASTEPDVIFGLSYILSEEQGLKAFTWPNRSCHSAAIRVNPSTRVPELCLGTTGGFVERHDTGANYSLNNGDDAYSYRVTTPQILIAPPQPRGDQPIGLHSMYMKSRPVGNWNINVSLQRDQETAESYDFDQGTEGFVLGTSELDTGILGGNPLQTVVNNILGEARSIQLDITQGGLNQGAEVYEVGVDYDVVGVSVAGDLT
jgi:hypothetical protein